MVYKLQEWLFPPRCLVCGKRGANGKDICPSCLRQLPENTPSCSRCAQPLPSSQAAGSMCGSCARKEPPFRKIIAPWRYATPLDELIQALKFRGKLPAGRLLGELLAERIATESRPELLVPIPRHERQLRKHGLNQSSEITRFLSRASGIPWSPWLLTKIRETAAQHKLPRRRRLNNLKDCFAFDNQGDYRHIAVIDDIVTTGATAREAALALKKAGVRTVDIWAIARTPEQH